MRNFITILIGLLTLNVVAQETRPSIIGDDKAWLESYTLPHSQNDGDYVMYTEYTLRDGKIIDDIQFMEIYQRTRQNEIPKFEEWSSNNEYLGEQNGKVYLYNEASQQKLQVMDFSLNVGDTYRQYNWDNGDSYEDFVVTDVSTIVIEKSTDKTPRKCLYLSRSGSEETTEVWVEGIGSLTGGIYGAYEQLIDGAVPCLIQCTVGDEIIYLDTTATGIQTSQTVRHIASDTQIYNLQGQQLKSMPHKGIYIRGGKKQVVCESVK